MNHELESRSKRNINNLQYADDTTLMADSEEELKSLLKRVKKQSEKAGLKLHIQKTKIMASGPLTSWQIEGKRIEVVTAFTFLGSKITDDGDCSHKIKRLFLLERKAMTNLDSILKSRDITLQQRSFSQSHDFSSSHVQMWELDHKEGWAPKNCFFWIVVREKTLESPLGWKEITPISLKGNQPWMFIGRAEAETLILWPPDVKTWLIGKDLDAGKDWRQRRRGRQKMRWSDSIQWAWICTNSRRKWKARESDMLQSVVPQGVTHGSCNWTTTFTIPWGT